MPALIDQRLKYTGTAALVLSVLAILLAVSMQNTECASASSGSCAVGDTETFASGISVNTDLTTNDTVISGDTETNLFFADSSTDRIGIGVNTPTELLDVAGNVAITGAGTLSLANDLDVVHGGTGVGTFTDGGVLIGNGTGDLAVTTAGTAGQYLTSNGPGVDPTFQTPSGGGIDNWDWWRLTTSYSNPSGDQIIDANLERVDTNGFQVLGSGMTESSGQFSFPETGYWAVAYTWGGRTYGAGDSKSRPKIWYTDDAWATNSQVTETILALDDGFQEYGNVLAYFYISDTTNQQIRFTSNVDSATGDTYGDTNITKTGFQFVRFAE